MKTQITLNLTAANGGVDGEPIPAEATAIFDPKNGQVNTDGVLINGDRVKGSIVNGILLDAAGVEGVWLEPGQYWASVIALGSRITRYVEVPESTVPILLTSLFELEVVPGWRLTEAVVSQVEQARDEAVAAAEGAGADPEHIAQVVNDVLLSGEVELPPGPEGPAGPEGPRGPAGLDGADGAQGIEGPRGLPGEDGLQGPPGRDGIDGTDGAPGTDGAEGPRGLQGIQGEPGADGSDGAPGADGASAYEIAVAEGFVGTEAAFLDSLVGPEGLQGERGPTGPQGPSGEDGIAGQQPNFVSIARDRTPYSRATLTRNAGGDLTYTCHADDTGEHTLTYGITAGTRYRLVSTITESGSSNVESIAPPPGDYFTVYPDDQRLYDGTITTTGAWQTATTWYTTEVGATWETAITSTSPDSLLYMNFFVDSRGGVWRVSLAEEPSVSADVSTYRATTGDKLGEHVLTIPEPGTYTLKGEFIGPDPSNAPSGGVARGWMLAGKSDRYAIRLSSQTLGHVDLSVGSSNKNFALKVKNPDAGGEEFIPYHGTEVETLVGPARFFDGATEIDVDSLTVGEPVQVQSLSMIQHMQGHSPALLGDELIDVETVDTLYPDGTYRAEGTMRVLRDVLVYDQTYTGMLPFNPEVLNQVVTAFRNGYPSTPDMTGHTLLGDEGLHSTSFAIVGDDPGLLAAVTFNNPEESRRMSQSSSLGNAVWPPMFIEHRNSTFHKLYPRFGYIDDELVSAGTVWRFSIDYWFGRVPGIRKIVE